mmetsp:Transcript_104548/g.248842  ORF Transcript_104548/g.248842 Transcript_104548/m.248842 type:complete len:93 (-) Transcript_104548:173-451(-)
MLHALRGEISKGASFRQMQVRSCIEATSGLARSPAAKAVHCQASAQGKDEASGGSGKTERQAVVTHAIVIGSIQWGSQNLNRDALARLHEDF